jgi:hypothetical protein
MKKQIILFSFLLLSSCYLLAGAPSHDAWDKLLKKYVTAEGKVDYKGFIKDTVALNAYLKTLSDNPPDSGSWTANEQKAYWINAYNAFTVKLITKYYPVKSIKDIGSKVQVPFVNTPWDIKFIVIGKEKMDLNNIEHQKLRKKFNDPRIHFAIVCASISCPKLLNEAYRADKLDAQLDQEAKAFLSDTTRNKISTDAPQLSKLFDWYKMDFTKKGSLIDFLNKYTAVKINANAKITYLDYNWNLNEQ